MRKYSIFLVIFGMWVRIFTIHSAKATEPFLQEMSVSATPEEPCNGVDDNNNGQIDEGFDLDGDLVTNCGSKGYYIGPVDNCNSTGGPCETVADCDDTDANVYPANPADEEGAFDLCNGIDDNCNGAFDEPHDDDEDTYTRCGTSTVDGAAVGTDCVDQNAAIHPGAAESCNSYDEDCSGVCDQAFDQDGDGISSCGTQTADEIPLGGYCTILEDCNEDTGDCDRLYDCNDSNSDISPLVSEVCNGIDDNCNGLIDDGCGGSGNGGSDGTNHSDGDDDDDDSSNMDNQVPASSSGCGCDLGNTSSGTLPLFGIGIFVWLQLARVRRKRAVNHFQEEQR